jgi:Response regulator containing CheY-like receiver domain and AraC-type DNA-binding domain
MKIVIAEDEFLIADMLASVLEDAGHVVRSAPDGVVALELIRQDPPDLIITDFMMPLMTGLELAECLRGDPEFRDLPIMLVSGAQGAIARSRADLFDRVIDKPYHFDALLEAASAITQTSNG